jgi:hypothetical protein
MGGFSRREGKKLIRPIRTGFDLGRIEFIRNLFWIRHVIEKRKRETKAFIFLTRPVVRIGFDLVLLSIGGAEEARDERRRARPRWVTDKEKFIVCHTLVHTFIICHILLGAC